MAGGAARGRVPWASAGSGSPFVVERRGLDQAGAALLPEAVADAAGADHLAVVEQPVENRGCHHGVAEHGPHSPTERLAMISMLPRSWRRDTSWKNGCAVNRPGQPRTVQGSLLQTDRGSRFNAV